MGVIASQNLGNADIIITFPDGATRTYPTGVTGFAIAEGISKSLAKKALAVEVNGEQWDVTRPIPHDAALRIITSDMDEALEIIRHDAAHVMAQAVQELYPDTQVTIGPAIENGFYYDFARPEPFTSDDLITIENKMRDIIKRDIPFTREVWTRADAIKHFEGIGEHYKAELIASIPEDQDISIYRQGAEWMDLCRGPHLPSTGKIGTAFKLTHVAGAYWRGDAKNAVLQRIYGTAWRTDAELQAHLTMLEEAAKRDHRKLGREMDLFHFEDSAPGQVFWHANGWVIFQELMDYMRAKIRAHNYIEVNTPQMLDAVFWKKSGHWDKYYENMFVLNEEDEAVDDSKLFALKPMSCPGNIQLYKQTLHSYRDFPIRMAEFGRVFRRESSGARHGLMRVQAFTQDDAHIFCRDDQLENEVVAMCDLIKEVYSDLGIADNITVKFSTRPEQRIGSEEDWDRAEAILLKVCNRINMKWVLNEGDGAFYAPKLDFVLTDAIGRNWQCGTVQVDMNLPNRLDITYMGEDGEKHRPHMVHRAILGSIERFIGVLIEHYAGKFPLWLAPTQVVVATITNAYDGYGEQVAAAFKNAGLRVQTDFRAEKITYKIREHSTQKVPIILVVGEKEQEARTVAIRRLDGADQTILSLEEAIKSLKSEAKPPHRVEI